MNIRTYARAAGSLFRLSALRVASGFRKMSYENIGVISGITPTDVMAMELKRISDRVKIIGRTLTTEKRRYFNERPMDPQTYRKCTELG